MKTVKRTVVADERGFVMEFKVETCEWNPVKPPRMGLSKSAAAIMSLEVGEVKRIYHPELKCDIVSGGNYQHCNLQPTIYKMRKKGWELEYYHEKDHVIVVRRLK